MGMRQLFWLLLWGWSLTLQSAVGAKVVSVADYQTTGGMTVTEVRTQHPNVRAVSNSFLLLVSINMEP